MLDHYGIVPRVTQAEVIAPKLVGGPQEISHQLGMRLFHFLEPLMQELYVTVDKRLIRTGLQTVEAILAFRDRMNGLLLSELGGYLDPLGKGGGTKRLSNLIHSQDWQARQIEAFLWGRADQQIQQWQAWGEDGLMIWDDTVLEKPESLAPEGLCAVRSSKALRLTHYKKGYYRPPSKPIFVPGLHGIGLLLAGRSKRLGPTQLACLQWWTSRGVLSSWARDENCQRLRYMAKRWGRCLIHIFDQGYASSLWLGALRGFDVRFIQRWNKKYHLVDAKGVKQATWKISRGKRAKETGQVWDAVHHRHVMASVLFFPVTHPDFPDWPLTLLVARRKGGEPWYLLTNEVVQTQEQAWKIVFAYARRWQVEISFRSLKSELAIQSVRVYDWEVRLKLLGLLTLAYAFLMDLMHDSMRAARDWLMDYACHRTGSHLQQVCVPFTRVRIALSKLWLQHPCCYVRRSSLPI